MSMNSFASDQASFLQTRDPSIWGWDQRVRFADPARKQLFNEILEEESSKGEKSGINTYLRLKPSAVSVDQATFSILNDTTIVTNPPKDSNTFKNKLSGRVVHQYTFSKVFGPDTTQKDIFDECIANQIKDVILGSNCLLFAYGTTNAGKTFTIQGNGCSPGVIPRSLDLLFKSIQGQVANVGKYKPEKVEGIVRLDSTTITQELDYKNRILQWNWDKALEPIKSGKNASSSSCNTSGGSELDFISSTFREMQKTLSGNSPVDMSTEGDVVYGVWVSFAEVYNECVFDLLDPIVTRHRKRVPLKMTQDGEGNTFIKDLKLIHVSSGDEAFHVMLYGKANLQVASTNMNAHSSRSHCIFTIRLVRYANSDDPSYAIVSSFTFCDLAGAERAKKTLNAGDRLKESNNINTSLHVLGRCLATIRENQKRNEKKPIPFRDSKLTRIFQRALTKGGERITMVVNVNTSPMLFDETVNVLKFSAIAKQIVLETPIKVKKPVKKSRFSIMVTRPNPHGTICWDAPPPEDDDTLSERFSSETCVQKYNAQNEELLRLVESLKEQAAMEREKNLNLERKIRQSVTNTFSKIINDMEKSWKQRLQEIEERNESLSSWRIAQVENYYKSQLEQQMEGSRKRPRDSEADDSIVVCEGTTEENRIRELESEVEILESKCSAIHVLLKEAQEIQASLASDNSTLKFEVANAKLELEKCQRQLLASEDQTDGSTDGLTSELQQQLAAETKRVTIEMKKNENLRELLDEAKKEFEMLNMEKDEVDKEANLLRSELVEKEEEINEANQQLEATQLLLTQKSRTLDMLEENLDGPSKDYEETMQTVEELQKQLSSLTMSDNEGSTDFSTKTGEEIPKSLSSLTLSLSDIVQTKVAQFKKAKSDSDNLRLLLEQTSKSLKLKEEEEINLRQKVDKLEKQLEEAQSLNSDGTRQGDSIDQLKEVNGEQQAVLESLQTSKSTLENEVSRLKAMLLNSDHLRDESVKHANQLHEDAKLLQKDLKDMLQKNIRLEQQLKDLQSELESSQSSSSQLEQELKSVLQKSSSQLNLSSSQIEIETLGAKVKTYEKTMKYFEDWKEEANRTKEQLNHELKIAREESQRRDEELKTKDTEVSTIHAHRTDLINRYEEALKKVQEELEREKREVNRLRDTLYKSTPTPKKNESAELRRLKELVESLQNELSLKKTEEQMSAKKLTKSAKKTNKLENTSSSESLKENFGESFAFPSSSSKLNRPTNVDAQVEAVTTSESKVKSNKEVSSVSHPALSEGQAEVKSQRKARKLFSRQQTISVEDEPEAIEVECVTVTTPNSFVKRSLRNRKV